jgi:hypothetical protein
MTSRLAALALLCVASSGTQALAADPVGAWAGSYRCGQGLTAGDLVIARSGPNGLRAVFHFFAHASNPGVPEGCFTLNGTIDNASGRISLRPGRWLVQPPGYVMAGLDGELDALSTSIDGTVIASGGMCADIHLRFAPTLPPARSACRIAP